MCTATPVDLPRELFANVGTLSSLLPGSGIQTYDFPVSIALAASTRATGLGLAPRMEAMRFGSSAFFNGSDVGVTGQFVDDTGVVSSDTSEVFLMETHHRHSQFSPRTVNPPARRTCAPPALACPSGGAGKRVVGLNIVASRLKRLLFNSNQSAGAC